MNRSFTTREKVLLTVLAFLIIAVGYFKLILTPINDSIARNQAMTASEQDEITVDTVLLARRNAMQKELEEIRAAGEEKPLPAYDNSERLLLSLNAVLKDADEVSLSFSEPRRLDAQYIVCRTVKLSFATDTYAQARSILDALYAAEEINQVTDLSIELPENDGEKVQTSLSVTFFELDADA